MFSWIVSVIVIGGVLNSVVNLVISFLLFIVSVVRYDYVCVCCVVEVVSICVSVISVML